MIQPELTNEEIRVFARMHRVSLPHSLVARLGTAYAEAFYRYVTCSSLERILVCRDGERVIAGCVASVEPLSLTARLRRETPLIRHALLAFPRLPWGALVRGLFAPHRNAVQGHGPEIILIFTDPNARSRGIGARLVADTEHLLREEGHTTLWVKTLADQRNRAIPFYERCGYRMQGGVAKLGKRLAVFRKAL